MLKWGFSYKGVWGVSALSGAPDTPLRGFGGPSAPLKILGGLSVPLKVCGDPSVPLKTVGEGSLSPLKVFGGPLKAVGESLSPLKGFGGPSKAVGVLQSPQSLWRSLSPLRDQLLFKGTGGSPLSITPNPSPPQCPKRSRVMSLSPLRSLESLTPIRDWGIPPSPSGFEVPQPRSDPSPSPGRTLSVTSQSFPCRRISPITPYPRLGRSPTEKCTKSSGSSSGSAAAAVSSIVPATPVPASPPPRSEPARPP